MAGAGYRTFASGEVLTSTNVQTYLMDQAVQVYSGTAARASAVPSPSTGMVAYSTATGLQVFNGSAWVAVGGGYGVFTGGNSTATGVSISGSTYTVLTFTSDSNLVCATSGLIDVLLIAGGGAGAGAAASFSSSGGGGGGVLEMSAVTTLYLAAGTYAVDVGAGGTGGVAGQLGTLGLESAIGNVISVSGGGFGGNSNDGFGRPGASGGGTCGGGIGAKTVQASVGNNGGDGNGANTLGSGGGGGAGGVGGNAVSSTGGAGGNGIDISGFTGAGTYYAGAGGGGGGTVTGGTAGNGGVAGKTTGVGNNGSNYGAGGGGTAQSFAGGNGAAGAVIIRFKTS